MWQAQKKDAEKKRIAADDERLQRQIDEAAAKDKLSGGDPGTQHVRNKGQRPSYGASGASGGMDVYTGNTRHPAAVEHQVQVLLSFHALK